MVKVFEIAEHLEFNVRMQTTTSLFIDGKILNFETIPLRRGCDTKNLPFFDMF